MLTLIANIMTVVFAVMAMGSLTIQQLPDFMKKRELIDSQTAVHTANALRGIAFAILAHLTSRYGGF